MDLKPANLSHSKKRTWSNFIFKNKVWLSVLLVIFLLVFWWTRSSSNSVGNFVFGGNPLQESDEGRVNLLLLGIGGGNHEGSTLTDSIVVAGYDPNTNRVDLISLPRDIWVEKHKMRVNALYQTGLARNEGLKFVETEIGEMLGTEIPYALVVDFDGFVKAVDLVGGIDVEVPNTFDDYEYPITGKEDDLCGFTETEKEFNEEQAKPLNIPAGKRKVYLGPGDQIATDTAKLDFSCRYEHIHFNKGPLHLDGTTALKFVRSRHGNNSEGSDFARSRRQEAVIQGFRNKVLSAGTLTDPTKIVGLIQTFGDSISTDIPQTKYLNFMKMIQKVDTIKTHVIGLDNKQNLLINPDPLLYGGAWVLIPPKNDFGPIHKYVDDIFSGKEATDSAQPSPSASVSPSKK